MAVTARPGRNQNTVEDCMTEQLKPCPFCGGSCRAQSTITDAAVWCVGCGAKLVRLHRVGTTVDWDSMPRAIAAWNRRAEVPS